MARRLVVVVLVAQLGVNCAWWIGHFKTLRWHQRHSVLAMPDGVRDLAGDGAVAAVVKEATVANDAQIDEGLGNAGVGAGVQEDNLGGVDDVVLDA